MIKNKYLLLLAFLIIFVFSSANFALALEAKFSGLGENPTLPEYVSFIFTWAIGIAGVLSLISFAIGAVGLIVSGDSPELASSSKDRMKGAILGLVLTLASFIIMYTINPALTTPTLTPLTPVDLPPPAEQFGVYYYLDPNCEGTPASIFTSSQNRIENPSGGGSCLKIVDDDKNEIFYGVIIHQTAGLENGGICMPPTTSDIGNNPIQLDPSFKTFAADIFKLNMEYSGSAGDGVTFYSEPHGWDSGAKAGFYFISDDDIDIDTTFDPRQMCFNYTNIDRPMDYWNVCCSEPTSCPTQQTCECTDNETILNYGYLSRCCCPCSKQYACDTFRNCAGSIKKTGDYLIGLYSDGWYCQTFTKDVENLRAQPFIASGGKYVETIYIIPIKN